MKKFRIRHLLIGLFVAAQLLPLPASAAPGDLYVAAFGNVFQITPSGTKSVFTTLTNPEGVAFDAKGDLYVSDINTDAIYRFSTAGTENTFAEDLDLPFGLAFDSAGNLFAAGSRGSVAKISPAGTKTIFAAGLGSPLGLAFDRAGNLFVADQSGSTIFKFTPAGIRTTFATGLTNPTGLAFDAAGDLFVSTLDGVISKFTPAGVQSIFAVGFNAPTGLAFDSAGNLFVADFNEGTVQKITPAGETSTFATGLFAAYYMAFEPETEKLRNLSTRGFVQTGDSVLIGGFIVGGSALATNAVVVRALGPSLADFGVADALLDPTLEIHDSSGALIAANDDWEDTQASRIEATGLAPNDPLESAIYLVLPAGAYTAIVRGLENTTGNALVEVYSTQ